MFRCAKIITLRNFSYKNLTTSALYITGDKAQENFAALTPHIDIVERFENRPELDENIKARGLNLDLDGIAGRWGFYQSLEEKRQILEYTKNKLSKQVSSLMQSGKEKHEEDISKLKMHISVVKDEYSTLKQFLYGVEESAALKALSLPNILHPKTPKTNESVEVFQFLSKPSIKTSSHIEIGKENQLLEISDNTGAYLLNEAALFELAINNYFQEHLLEAQLIPFSNCDFARSIIVEGCGTELNDEKIITLHEENGSAINRLHLTGGASHYTFMAYFTKLSVPPTQFPLNYFALGRKYQMQNLKDEVSLFNLMQQSSIEIFTASRSNEEINDYFEKLIELLSKLFQIFECHFRMVIKPAKNLEKYESLRMEIQMFSNYLNDYVEIGRVSLVDDYLSKRLLFTYTENKEHKFPKLIVGNILNVQKVLGCLLENRHCEGRKDLISDKLSNYVP